MRSSLSKNPVDDALLQRARRYAANGTKFLEENVPGWLERARRSPFFEMGTMDYCALAITCKGVKLRGRYTYTAGDVARAFPEIELGKATFGFYAGLNAEVDYDYLQIAWEEIFERGVLLQVA